MAWERRRNGRYYYRARKINGRVVKEYVGQGPLADAASERDALARAARTEAREQRLREQRVFQAADDEVDAFVTTLDSLTCASVILGGYHQHRGSEWRKRRHV
jgi:nucleotide-binding universal stress UspA family protein